MPNFCMLPAEAEQWLATIAYKRSLTVLRDPKLEYRRWLGTRSPLPLSATERPGEYGLVMLDQPQQADGLLLIGALGVKAYDDAGEAAAEGRSLVEGLGRDLRRVCTIPLLAGQTGKVATDSKPACWATPAAVTQQQGGVVIKQFAQGFVEFVPAPAR